MVFVYGGPETVVSDKSYQWTCKLGEDLLTDSKTLQIELFDKDRFSKDDFMGTASFVTAQLRPNVESEALVLGNAKAEKAGSKIKISASVSM